MTLVRRSMCLGALLALMAVCGTFVYLFRLERNASDVVAAVYKLSLSPNPPTIQDLRQRFGSTLRQPDPCTPDGCGYDLFLSNHALAVLHLAPYTALRSSFWVRNGIVDQNTLEFWTLGRGGGMVLSYVVVKYCSGCESFTIHPSANSSPLGTTGSVEIGYASTVTNKGSALALNTGCLLRLRGCKSIAEISPRIWQQNPDRTISCKIPNHDGVVDESASPR